MENTKKIRRKFSAAFKSKVALEALSGLNSTQELAEKFELNQNQIFEWKKTLISNAYLAFTLVDAENNNDID